MTVTHLSGFATACQQAIRAVLHAMATVGEERRGHLSDAKMAVDKALHDAHSGNEWCLADHLRQGVKDLEARTRDAS